MNAQEQTVKNYGDAVRADLAEIKERISCPSNISNSAMEIASRKEVLLHILKAMRSIMTHQETALEHTKIEMEPFQRELDKCNERLLQLSKKYVK